MMSASYIRMCILNITFYTNLYTLGINIILYIYIFLHYYILYIYIYFFNLIIFKNDVIKIRFIYYDDMMIFELLILDSPITPIKT